ncbi:acyl carrier protein [Primorskyibacter sp. 2E107]|uniref:acyl carrier protein n=1 Tax=Primorskyibacter sp. 2E107 TaxID=3403458 RepID=UPI003AF5DEE8
MTSSPLPAIISWIEDAAAPRFGAVDVTPETPLLEEQLLDSLQLMDLVYHLEETQGVTIPLEMLTPENFATPNAVAQMLAKAAA